jgi:hypothetical protein
MLPKLAALAPGWCSYFGGSQALEDLIVHLALGCEHGGTQILKLLLDAASPVNDPTTSASDSSASASVMATSREILGNKEILTIICNCNSLKKIVWYHNFTFLNDCFNVVCEQVLESWS